MQKESKPAVKKDKIKIIDEVWTVERIKAFLDLQPAAGIDLDFHLLSRAYQSMIMDDFRQFITFFTDAKHNINAQNPEGETLLSIVVKHRHGGQYTEILKQAGAS